MTQNRYIIMALNNETGEEVEIIVSASSENAAIQEAEKRTSSMIDMKVKKIMIGGGI